MTAMHRGRMKLAKAKPDSADACKRQEQEHGRLLKSGFGKGTLEVDQDMQHELEALENFGV